MEIKILKKIAFLMLDVLVDKLINHQSIFHRLSVISLIFLGTSLIPTLWDSIVDNFFESYSKENGYEDQSMEPLLFTSFLFTTLTFVFAFLSLKCSNKNEKITNNVTKEEWVSIGGSKIHSFNGSVLNISNIDVIVTSENSSLSLGSINGISVSGRTRYLAASYNHDMTLSKDNLLDSIEIWKRKQPNRGPYQLGLTIASPPFNASYKGVKSILHAVTVNKNSSGEHLVDEHAINNIIESVLKHCKDNNYKSVFIPVFGLGSGRNERKSAIEKTLQPLINMLHENEYSINIYIGTYRLKDLLFLSKFLLKSKK